jgi:hypothetical protein
MKFTGNRVRERVREWVRGSFFDSDSDADTDIDFDSGPTPNTQHPTPDAQHPTPIPRIFALSGEGNGV